MNRADNMGIKDIQGNCVTEEYFLEHIKPEWAVLFRGLSEWITHVDTKVRPQLYTHWRVQFTVEKCNMKILQEFFTDIKHNPHMFIDYYDKDNVSVTFVVAFKD